MALWRRGGALFEALAYCDPKAGYGPSVVPLETFDTRALRVQKHPQLHQSRPGTLFNVFLKDTPRMSSTARVCLSRAQWGDHRVLRAAAKPCDHRVHLVSRSARGTAQLTHRGTCGYVGLRLSLG